MKKYTVLLLYPDYVTDVYGQDTYQDHVEAACIKEAVAKARLDCEQDTGISFEHLTDLYVLAVYEGHLHDLKAPFPLPCIP
jgi:hypothetical protein